MMRWLTALALGAALALAGPALADTTSRFPETGAAHIQMTSPDDWSLTVDDTAIQASSVDTDCFVYVSLLPWSEMPSRDPAYLAADMFKKMEAKPSGPPLTGVIDGRAAKTFTTVIQRGHLAGDMRLTLAPLGETGMAIEVDFCMSTAAPEAVRARDAILASVKITAP